MTTEQDYKARFAALIDAIDDAVFTVLPEKGITDCNAAAVRMTGHDREKLLTLAIEDIFDGDTSALTSSAPDDEQALTISGTLFKHDESRIPVSITVRRVGPGTELFLTVRDISEKEGYESELKVLKRQLRQSEKLEVLGRLAGGITHYYNNIFTGLIGALDMAKNGASDDVLPLLRRAEKVANTASGFTRRLLAFTRESDESRRPTDITEIIGDVGDFARMTFDKRITVETRVGKNIGAVLGDPAEIHHAILNLVVNARDALTEKAHVNGWDSELTILIEATTVTNTSDTSPMIRITVTDTGTGMDRERRTRAFDAFYTTKERGKGTGIGLAAVRETVRSSGGTIDIESEPGTGTSISIIMPSLTMKKKTAEPSSAPNLPPGTESVLIVDDDDMIRMLGTMTLERLGYRVLPAVDGGECVDVFTRERDAVDLVVIDLRLPVLSGEDALRRIRRIRPDIPVIVTSGHDFEHDPEAFDRLMADDYIVKPFTVADFALSVRSVLDRNRNHGSRHATVSASDK